MFVKLTRHNPHGVDPVICAEKIVAMHEERVNGDLHTKVVVEGGLAYRVRETPHQILAMAKGEK